MDCAGTVLSSAIFYVRNKFKMVPPWLWLLQIIVTSFFTMYFFVILSKFVSNPEITVRYVVIGNVVQSMATTTLFAVSESPGIEKHTGTLPSLMETPASLFQIFIGMSFLNIFAGIISCSLSLLYAQFVFSIDLSAVNMASVVIIMLLTVLSLAGMGMMVGGIGLRLRTSAIMANLVAYIGILICGVNYPLSYLPEIIQVIANVFPLTFAVKAMRGAADGMDIASLSGDIVPMVILGLVYLVIAYVLFEIFERRARVTGSFEKF